MPPFYVLLVLAVLVLSLASCAVVYIGGRRTLPLDPLSDGQIFPTKWDTIFTAVFIAVFAVSLAANQPLHGEDTSAVQTLSTKQLVLSMLLQALLYVPMVIRYALLPRDEHAKVGFGRGAALVFVAVGSILLFGALLGALQVDKLIMQFTGCPEQQDVVQCIMDGNTAQRVVLAAAAVIMAPIGEEVCFRGFVYRILRSRAGVWAAAIASGCLFGAVHASLVQFLSLAFFGVVQCLLYERCRTLTIPMAVHAVFNSLSVLFILLMPYLPEYARNL